MARSIRRSVSNHRLRKQRLWLETLEARLPMASDLGLDADPWQWQPYHPAAVAVYAPDTDPKVLQLRPDALGPKPGEQVSSFQFNDTSRWSSTATNGGGLTQGDPTTITWGIVPDGTPVSGFNGEPASPSNLISFLGGIYGVTTADANVTDEPWFGLFQSYLNRWSALSGISYVYASNDDGVALSSFNAGILGVRPDIRISGHFIDGNSNILAYNFFPNGGDMVIDTGDINFYSNNSNNSRALRNVLAHENGHGLGLDHVCPVIAGVNGRLMEPFINLSIDGPQFDDILAMHRGYGDVLEKNGGNNNAATASPLGLLGAGQTILRGTDAVDIQVAPTEVDFVSIDDDSDVDYFSFTVGNGMGANIELTPLGATYLSGPQNLNGTCSAGTLFNASMQSDLTLQLIGPDGSMVLNASNTAGLGGAESINSTVLVAGTYYVRVSGSANAAQMYRLGLTGVPLTGVLITESGGSTTVSENGAVDTYTLNMANLPVGTVQVTITADSQTQVSSDGVNFAATAVLNFSDTLPQTVTVRAINDSIGEGAHTSLITHAITATGDPVNYPLSLVLPTLTVNILDNDLAQFVRRANLGSLIATSDNNLGILTGAADQVDLQVFLSAGQTIAASATASNAAILSLTLVGVAGPFAAPSAGMAAILPATTIASSGIYQVRVTATAATTFNLQAILNASIEGVDTSIANKLNLASSAITLAPQVTRHAVVGRTSPTLNPLQFTSANNPSLFIDIAATGTPLSLVDDGVGIINTTVGNSILPAGAVTVSNNGVIVAGNQQQVDFTNVNLPTTQFGNALLPFWDDLFDSSGNVYWEQRTIGGVAVLIVQWENRPHYSNSGPVGNATFQVQLFASGPVQARFAYKDVDFGSAAFNFGASATIGYQANSSSAIGFSFNSPSVANGTVLELLAPIVPDVDAFELDLSTHVGQPIDVVLTGLSSDFSGQVLELIAPDGNTVWATGSPQPLGTDATNLDLAIVNFVVPSAGSATVRVSSGQAGQYGLGISSSLRFDIEPNNSPNNTLRALTTSQQALGYLSSGSDIEDRYQIQLTQGQAISISTRTPFDQSLSTPVNNLDPELSVISTDGLTVLANNQNSANDGKNAGIAFTAPTAGMYTIRVAATAGSGEYGLFIAPGIIVDQMIINSTSWSPIFRDFLDGGFNDGQASGYRFPSGSSQSVPWINVNEIKLKFTADVGASLSASDFTLAGQNGFDSNGAGFIPPISSVSWDVNTLVGTLHLAGVLGPNRVTVTALAADIRSGSGVPLSANQQVTFFVLTGDAADLHVNTNGQYTVNGSDSVFVNNHLSGILIDLPGVNPIDGALAGYDLRADINADGIVNGSDSVEIILRLNSLIISLPPPPPVLNSSGSNPIESRAGAVMSVSSEPAAQRRHSTQNRKWFLDKVWGGAIDFSINRPVRTTHAKQVEPSPTNVFDSFVFVDD